MIIGLIGFKQVGKSTAAKHLEDNYDFLRHNFKDALVAEMKENLPDILRELGIIYSISIDELFDQKPPAMRALMQNYGTDVRRKGDPDYWVKEWTKDIPQGGNVVTDDVRFKNEANALREQGGILIRLTRPDMQSGGTHVSETEQTEILPNYTIECEKGDHAKLYAELDKIMNI